MLWGACLVCSCIAVLMIRIGPVFSDEAKTSERESSQDLDYVCVADAALPLRPSEIEQLDRAENKLEVRFAVARRRCRPPLVPELPGSSFLGSAMDFDSGYGGMLRRFDGDKQRAVAAAEAALTQVGWQETPASRRVRDIKKGTTVRMFEREGAWLLAVSVDASGLASDGGAQSAVFVAGQWRQDILEKL